PRFQTSSLVWVGDNMESKSLRSIGFGMIGALLIGLVVVAGALPASAEMVTDEAGFRDAFANEAAVELQNDITLSCDGGGVAARTIAGNVIVDGGGFTVHQSCAGQAVLSNTGGGTLTLNNVTIS